MANALAIGSQKVQSRNKIVISVRLQLFCTLALILSLGAKVWVKLRTVELGYVLAKEQQRSVEYDLKRRELELKLSVLMRPDQLAGAARSRLGLQAFNPAQVRRLGM